MDGIGSIGRTSGPTGGGRTPEDDSVRELKETDRKVRAHEQAHRAAAGNLATGGPSFEFRTGSDGGRYAVGGEVNIRISEGRTPQDTLRNARQAQSAALAPADPSPQDLRVAREASVLEAKARTELSRSSTDATRPGKSGATTPAAALGNRLDVFG